MIVAMVSSLKLNEDYQDNPLHDYNQISTNIFPKAGYQNLPFCQTQGVWSITDMEKT